MEIQKLSFLKAVKHLIFFVIFSLTTDSWSETLVVSHNFSPEKQRENPGYEYSLLVLSLEKTREKYGSYRLNPVRDDMSRARSISKMKTNSYKNFIRSFSYNKTLGSDNTLSYIPFPAYLGVLSYRVCFTSSEVKKRLETVEKKDDLLAFSYGLGTGWPDVEVLRSNGFSVKEVTNYHSLFKMVAANRFDMFCRGANELLVEYNGHRDVNDLNYDKTLALYYPMPVFFYGHRDSKGALERIEEGLKMAYQDGALMHLWKKHFDVSVNFVQLDKRRVIELENPLIGDIDMSFERYFFRAK